MDNEQTPSLETMLTALMQDPAKMAQLQGFASTLGLTSPAPAPAPSVEPPAAAESAEAGETTLLSSAPPLDPAAWESLSALLPLLSGSGSSTPKKTGPNHRTALLQALRPYLSDGRREMIDAIVNFSRLGEMLGRGKGE